MFLKMSNRYVADISTMGSGGESFYPARREMPVKKTRFCSSFGCMKECCYAESGGEGIDDFGFGEDVDDFGLENPTRTFLGTEMEFEERLMRERLMREKKPVKGVAASPTPPRGVTLPQFQRQPQPSPWTSAAWALESQVVLKWSLA